MQRLAIIGHTGVVGSAIRRHAAGQEIDVVGISRSAASPDITADMTDAVALHAALDDARPSTVLLCSALTNVDRCEQEPEASREANVQAPVQIAEWCARAAVPLVFFSTDYVFDGQSGPYDESAACDPINVYGRHKLEAERAIASILPRHHLIVRTTGVYGSERARKNFVLGLIDRIGKQQTVRVPSDQYGTPTWSDDLAEATIAALAHGFTGILHVAGSTWLSRYDFARLAARILRLDDELLQPALTPELNQAAPRPLRAGLTSQPLERIIGRRMLTAEEGLSRFAGALDRDGR